VKQQLRVSETKEYIDLEENQVKKYPRRKQQ